jgi:uncharacterized protein (TIRG00374 family)
MMASIRSARYGWVLVSVVMGLVAFLSRAYRWSMLLEPLGYKPGLFNVYNAMMVGYLANFALPRLGEITRCTVLSEKEKIPFNLTLGTVFSERAVDVIMLGLSLLLAAYLEMDLIGGFIMNKIVMPLFEKVQGLASIPYILPLAGLLLLLAIAALFILRKRGTANKFISMFHIQLVGFLDGIRSVTRMKNKGWFLFHTFFIWILYFFMSYSVFFALDATSGLDYKAGIFTLAIGGIGMAAPVQGGIGVYHLMMQQGLTLFGIDPDAGIVYATILHTSQALMILLLGGLSLLFLFATPNKTGIDKTQQSAT